MERNGNGVFSFLYKIITRHSGQIAGLVKMSTPFTQNAATFSLKLLFCFQGPPPQSGQLKYSVAETCDRIKEEFNFLQTQYHT